jgi:hypothetical protein
MQKLITSLSILNCILYNTKTYIRYVNKLKESKMNNQLMKSKFLGRDLHIWHKTGMGSLTDIFSIGNISRGIAGKKAANITHFMNSKATKAFISIIAKRQQIEESEVIIKTGRGKSQSTFANIHLLIYAAEYLDPEFHYDIINEFITNKLFEWRDDSGEQFKAFNILLDNHLLTKGDSRNRYKYAECAKLIGEKVFNNKWKKGIWNRATADQLRQRTEYETKLIGFMEAGLVRDFSHLKELINNL